LLNNSSYGLLTVAGSNSTDYNFRARARDNATELFVIRGDGNVGIGTAGPNYKLDVQGGNVNSAGAYTNVSDIRLKQDIQPLENSLEKILHLRSVSYYWKDQSFDSSKQIGFIAQEVEKIFPEVVKTDSKGFKAMSYSQLVSPVVDAIKELYGELKNLVARVIRLEDKDVAKDRAIASVNIITAKLEAENAQLKIKDTAKDKKIKELELRLERIEKSLNRK
jgi:hypothetical protein